MATPKPIITDARLKQELTINKDGLAEWLRKSFESVSYSGFCQPTEIEPHVVSYTYDYDKMGELFDFVQTHAIAEAQKVGKKSFFAELKDSYVTGEKESKTLHASMDIDALFSQKITNADVTGITREQQIPTNDKALAHMMSAFSFSNEGLRINGQKLLAGLQGLIHIPTPDFTNLSDEQKATITRQIVDTYNTYGKQYIPSLQLSQKGGMLNVSFAVKDMVKLYAVMAEKAGLESAVTLHEKGDGTANLIIDYRQMVDVAAEKAKAALSDKKAARVTDVSADAIKLELTKEGMGPLFDGLLHAAQKRITDAARAMMPKETQHLGRLGDADGQNRQLG